MNFKDFKLENELLKALKELEYITPTQIQKDAIPHILNKKDLLGIAQTGTGKTAAFALPILNIFLKEKKQLKEKHPRALILAPTRELCIQIGENIQNFSKYTNIKSTIAHGGVPSQPQIETLKEKQDILIATPGRLVDLIKQKDVFLDEIEIFVLDEADNIIKMGQRVDLKKIIKKMPENRQNLFFSASMNDEIKLTTEELLKDPINLTIQSEKISLESIEQNVLFVLKENKIKTLLELLSLKELKRIIIFVNSKSTGDNIVRSLAKNNIESIALHSGKTNTHREKVIRNIKLETIKILVATDIASRGLDFNNMTHVINFEIPLSFETYLHRVGRVGRKGKKDTAYSLCSLDERNSFKKIEEENNYPINTYNHKFHSNMVRKNGGKNAKETRSKKNIKLNKNGCKCKYSSC